MLVLAWDVVTPKTPQKCFKRACFSKIEIDDLFDDLFSTLEEIIREISCLVKSLVPKDLAAVVSLVNDLAATQTSSEKDILGDHFRQHQARSSRS